MRKKYAFYILSVLWRKTHQQRDWTGLDSVEWVKYDEALSLLREGSIAWQLVKYVIEND